MGGRRDVGVWWVDKFSEGKKDNKEVYKIWQSVTVSNQPTSSVFPFTSYTF